MSVLDSYTKIKELLISMGCTNVEYYSLVNNDGYIFEYKNGRYDARHWRNVYGETTNFWEVMGINNSPVADELKDLQEKLNSNYC